jgi:hypothetical protein
MENDRLPPESEPAAAMESPPVLDPHDERLREAVARSHGDSAAALAEVCRHVLAERRYAASTRAVFAEILEQVRAGLGQGGIR